MTIGDRIKKAREESQKTQKELADYIHSTKQTVYKYENNIVTNIPSDKLEKIASYLNITPAYLMGWEDESGAPVAEEIKETSITPPLTDTEKELIGYYRSLNQKGKEKALDSVRDFTFITFYQKGECVD